MRGYGRNFPTGLALATSANGSKRTGTAVVTQTIDSMSVHFQFQITTASVVGTIAVEVSKDNATWLPLTTLTNTATTNTAAGTGSPVTTDMVIDIPKSIIDGWPYIRGDATLSGATTAAADKSFVEYATTRAGTVYR